MENSILKIKIGNWKVRTLFRNKYVTQIANEMGKKDIDIIGISETHWTGKGKLQSGD